MEVIPAIDLLGDASRAPGAGRLRALEAVRRARRPCPKVRGRRRRTAARRRPRRRARGTDPAERRRDDRASGRRRAGSGVRRYSFRRGRGSATRGRRRARRRRHGRLDAPRRARRRPRRAAGRRARRPRGGRPHSRVDRGLAAGRGGDPAVRRGARAEAPLHRYRPRRHAHRPGHSTSSHASCTRPPSPCSLPAASAPTRTSTRSLGPARRARSSVAPSSRES